MAPPHAADSGRRAPQQAQLCRTGRTAALTVTAALLLGYAAVAGAEPIDLSGATVVADRSGRVPGPAPAARTIDGDLESAWRTELDETPANVVIRLAEPVVVDRVEVQTAIHEEGRSRLSDLEVYGDVGDEQWALLGQVEDNGRERFSVDLQPTEVRHLRLRVLANHGGWVRIYDVAVHAADDSVEPVTLEPTRIDPIGDETYFMPPGEPPTTGVLETFDADKGYLGYARSFIDTMLEKGTDRYGDVHSPMFVSIIDVRTGDHPGVMTLPVPTQRQSDRAHMGGNLQFDIPLLKAMEQVTRLTGESRYKAATRDYLRFFLDHCTDTPTGLWSWGEHAYWDFYEQAPGENTNHEYNDDPGDAFWQLAWKKNPDAVIRQADGLIHHIVDLETFAYNRHARVDEPLPDPRPEGLTALDFPRQGGYFIRLWAFVHAKTGEPRYLDWIGRMLDHFDEITIADRDLLPGLSVKSTDDRATDTNPSIGQSRQVAVALHRALPYLEGTEIYDRVEAFYQKLRAALAVDPADAPPSVGFGQRRYPQSIMPGLLPEHGGPEGRSASTYRGEEALRHVQWYRLTGDAGALADARQTARAYADVERIPWEDYDHIRAGVLGMTINLLLDMHELDGGDEWLPAAERYARWAIERLYHDGLFLGATNRWYYDANLRVSLLAYALVRLHAVESGSEIDVPPMYFRPSR